MRGDWIMRYLFVCIFLLGLPAYGSAQEDLKCDLSKKDWAECQEQQWKSYLGKYLCLIDHVAGIQHHDDHEGGEPYVGRIKPTEEKFFMEVSEDSSLDCRADFPLPTATTTGCQMKYRMTVKSKNIFLRVNGWSASLAPHIFFAPGGHNRLGTTRGDAIVAFALPAK
jgi:hypothetical protein